ncbi:MAG: hypothetical protein IPH74_02785 [Bacteroidetes bacterium]|nr:hypothetical protein [Bacteroidota bacterium]
MKKTNNLAKNYLSFLLPSYLFWEASSLMEENLKNGYEQYIVNENQSLDLNYLQPFLHYLSESLKQPFLRVS